MLSRAKTICKKHWKKFPQMKVLYHLLYYWFQGGDVYIFMIYCETI